MHPYSRKQFDKKKNLIFRIRNEILKTLSKELYCDYSTFCKHNCIIILFKETQLHCRCQRFQHSGKWVNL